MISNLPDILQTDGALKSVSADCQELVGQELSSKSGVSAAALKVAYKAITAFAPGYYQNFVGPLAPQKQADGSVGWALPLDPDVRCLHMGDIRELGNIVAGAFAHPDEAGNGEYLPLVGDAEHGL